MTISAVILAKNEEEIINECVKSVSFCNETIVIDDNSSDKTENRAILAGANVYKHSLNNDFSAQRNFGLEKATCEWVLFIDADEKVSQDLAKEILKVTTGDNKIKGYFIKRVDYVWGKELLHGETGKFKILRLARKDSGIWNRAVHEKWNVNGELGNLENPIKHYPHKTLRDFISHIELYSSIHARANYDEGKKSNIYKIIFFPIIKFVRNYILKLGFLDGTVGMVHALFMSLHSYLSWSKLWLLQKELISKSY
jgi:glycosyltransferase involved in cell wall biosynthesis